MRKLFYAAVVRYAWQHRLLAIINVLSVALGTAVYLAIQIANHSATRSFQAGVDVVAGRADLEVRGAVPNRDWPLLRRLPGITAATPVVEGIVVLPDLPGEYLRLVGIDPFTNSAFQNFAGSNTAGSTFDSEAWFGNRHAIGLSRRFAEQHELVRGSRLKVQAGEEEVTLDVAFLLDTGEADSHFAALDIGWAQELLHVPNTLSAVLLRLQNPENQNEVIAEIKRIVPATVSVQPPRERSLQVVKLLGGFQLNLTALSLVSLLVGVFLIYNTISASAVRRRREIGILRSIGASRLLVRCLFLGEAMLYGAFGAICGIGAGLFLSNFLVKIVSRTVSDLYVLTSIEAFYVPLWAIPAVFLVGFITALVGAWVPAKGAGDLPPLQALHPGGLSEQISQPNSIWFQAGCAALLLAVLTGFLALHVNRLSGFLCAFFTLIGFCLFSPILTNFAGKFFQTALRTIVVTRLASRNFRRSINRNAVTIAALGAAVAMLVSVSVMIFSFRTTVDHWVSRRLVADLFITPVANEVVGFTDFIPNDLLRFIQAQPELAFLDTYRETDVEADDEPTSMGVVRGSGRNRPQFVGGDGEVKFRRFFEPGSILVSEPLATRRKWQEGQQITLVTPTGPAQFRIAGIFYDYTKDAGLIEIQEQNYLKSWHDGRVNSLALYLKPNTSVDQLIRRIRTDYPHAAAYAIHSNRDLRAVVTQIFDQTFAVTGILRIIAMGVAVIGIILNLTVLVKERERELSILRSIGCSKRQMLAIILWESTFTSATAVLLGIVAGCALAYVLTEVINKAFFGWTIPLLLPWEQLWLAAISILPVTILAGLWPAWQAAESPIIEGVRGEE